MSNVDYTAWEKFSEGETPGTTPLPEDYSTYLKPSPDTTVLDVGCGWGRGAAWLYIQGYSVIASDINASEVENAKTRFAKIIKEVDKNTATFSVDDASKKIDLPDISVDGVTVNGVLLAFTTPEQRKGFMNEIHRVLKPGGVVYLAEFSQNPHPEYKVNYDRHALITEEYGTIVSFNPGSGIIFKDKTDDELLALRGSKDINYYAHHYSEEELRNLLVEFDIESFEEQVFTTRSGAHINGFVVYARKRGSR